LDSQKVFGCLRGCRRFGRMQIESHCLGARPSLPGFVELYLRNRESIDCMRLDLERSRRFCIGMGHCLRLWRRKGYPWHNPLLKFYKFRQRIEMEKIEGIHKSSSKSKYSLILVDKCHLHISIRTGGIDNHLGIDPC